jgi:hypothetical protein
MLVRADAVGVREPEDVSHIMRVDQIPSVDSRHQPKSTRLDTQRLDASGCSLLYGPPWHRLYLAPDPQGHGSLRPMLCL